MPSITTFKHGLTLSPYRRRSSYRRRVSYRRSPYRRSPYRKSSSRRRSRRSSAPRRRSRRASYRRQRQIIPYALLAQLAVAQASPSDAAMQASYKYIPENATKEESRALSPYLCSFLKDEGSCGKEGHCQWDNNNKKCQQSALTKSGLVNVWGPTQNGGRKKGGRDARRSEFTGHRADPRAGNT